MLIWRTGVEKLGLQEEILKTSLINCLADVYRKAKAVVILDALVLRLDSVNPVETAAVLCCGGESSKKLSVDYRS